MLVATKRMSVPVDVARAVVAQGGECTHWIVQNTIDVVVCMGGASIL